MFDDNFWNEIKEKCPKAYNKAIDNLPTITINGYSKIDIKNICFCKIVNFFDDIGIIIEIVFFDNVYNYILNVFTHEGIYEIIENLNSGYKDRIESGKAAILKAFEIMENKQ